MKCSDIFSPTQVSLRPGNFIIADAFFSEWLRNNHEYHQAASRQPELKSFFEHNKTSGSTYVLDQLQFRNLLIAPQIRAIKQYQSQLYFQQIQYAYRYGDGISDRRCTVCKDLLFGLNKIPNYHGLVFRFSGLSPVIDKLGFTTPGSIASDPAFFSTSRDSRFIFDTNPTEPLLQFVIQSKTGKSIENVEAVAEQGSSEMEVLFLPGTRFLVKTVLLRTDGSKLIFMEEL